MKSYRSFETAVSDFARFPYWKHLLSLLLLVGAFATTIRNQHIALREPEHPLEFRVSQALQLVVHLSFLYSSIQDWRVGQTGTAEVEHAGLPAALGGRLRRARSGQPVPPRAHAPHLDQPLSGLRLVMSIPLYVYMGVLSIVYFLILEGHQSGQAIYLHKFVQHPSVYIGIGLYIWAGMMLAETRLARRAFAVITPWKLPPAILAWLVVVLAALPTAYSGASGIFVIAAGAVVFEQLRAAGASHRMALSATAMSGSLGVVLRPCLVVVLVAILNKQVTTDELFSRGFQVFVLTASLYLVAMLLPEQGWLQHRIGVRGRAQGGRSLEKPTAVPDHRGLGVGVQQRGARPARIGTHCRVDSAGHSDRLRHLRYPLLGARRGRVPRADQPTHLPGQAATAESSGHIGALLMLMAGSVGLGGVVERAELMSLVPADLGSQWTTMSILVVAMVLVGMTMDALGAVVLVSVTIAPLAYNNGIDPVHFWMMVLVAFELGYLTPPVAINHLLARQVIGAEARVENVPVEGGWWARNEHLWLPMAVMGTALVLVAFVPPRLERVLTTRGRFLFRRAWVPSSKSVTHRAFLLGALSDVPCRVERPSGERTARTPCWCWLPWCSGGAGGGARLVFASR